MLKTVLLCALLCYSTSVFADDFSVYGGLQSSPHSQVKGIDHENNSFDFTAGWEGKSLSAPIYYGVRYTKWTDNTGISLDFAHSKVYADTKTLNKSGFEVLEFTDGLNVLTLNYLTKYPNNLYWGIGAGITLPHVEVQTSKNAPETFEYQFGGYAIQSQIGIEKLLSPKWGVFAEYKANYTINKVDLAGSGNLETNIVVNAVNVGQNKYYFINLPNPLFAKEGLKRFCIYFGPITYINKLETKLKRFGE